jgi:hypothetical protein
MTTPKREIKQQIVPPKEIHHNSRRREKKSSRHKADNIKFVSPAAAQKTAFSAPAFLSTYPAARSLDMSVGRTAYTRKSAANMPFLVGGKSACPTKWPLQENDRFPQLLRARAIS